MHVTYMTILNYNFGARTYLLTFQCIQNNHHINNYLTILLHFVKISHMLVLLL